MDVRNRARSDKERLGDVFFTTHASNRNYGQFMMRMKRRKFTQLKRIINFILVNFRLAV